MQTYLLLLVIVTTEGQKYKRTTVLGVTVLQCKKILLSNVEVQKTVIQQNILYHERDYFSQINQVQNKYYSSTTKTDVTEYR